MLRRLNQRQAEHLALQVTFGHVLPSSLLDRIVAQTDGVPLFIEELAKAVVETSSGSGRFSSAPGSPRYVSSLSDGATRSASGGEAGGADRRADRA